LRIGARRNALQHAEAAAATARDSLKYEAETLQESRLQVVFFFFASAAERDALKD